MASHYPFSQVTPQIEELAALCTGNGNISPELYLEHNVYCGLRDLDGKGVLTGLTEISEIVSKKNVDGKLVPCEGELYYRGINVADLISGFIKDKRFGFEEVTYLLLFGKLPNAAELGEFTDMIGSFRFVTTKFIVLPYCKKAILRRLISFVFKKSILAIAVPLIELSNTRGTSKTSFISALIFE